VQAMNAAYKTRTRDEAVAGAGPQMAHPRQPAPPRHAAAKPRELALRPVSRPGALRAARVEEEVEEEEEGEEELGMRDDGAGYIRLGVDLALPPHLATGGGGAGFGAQGDGGAALGPRAVATSSSCGKEPPPSLPPGTYFPTGARTRTRADAMFPFLSSLLDGGVDVGEDGDGEDGDADDFFSD